MRIFLSIVGVLLLLPGACGAFFTFVALADANTRMVLLLSLPSLLVGIGGIYLIRYAWRRP